MVAIGHHLRTGRQSAWPIVSCLKELLKRLTYKEKNNYKISLLKLQNL